MSDMEKRAIEFLANVPGPFAANLAMELHRGMTRQVGTEPVLDYGNANTDTAWYDWLQAKDDKQLTAYWEYIRNWSPAQSTDDPDTMQIKYELTGQLMDERGL